MTKEKKLFQLTVVTPRDAVEVFEFEAYTLKQAEFFAKKKFGFASRIIARKELDLHELSKM
jgi:hypothetical protein